MFPLPLTPFEEYMLFEDCPAYPMAGVFRLQFSGFLDRDAFEAALKIAVRRHPLLRTTVNRVRQGRPRWVDHPDWCPDVRWQAETNSYGYPPAAYIDLAQEPGTRVWVADRDKGHDVIIQVHHCCADALGMSAVFEDLLIGYALNQGTPEGDVALPRLSPRRLLDRGTPGLTPWKFLKMLHKQVVGLDGVRKFLMRSPVPLLPPAAPLDRATPPPAFPTPRTYDFDPAKTKKVIAAAKSLGTTVNDLLVRDLFLAVGQWRSKTLGDNLDWLRFSIPMGLRTPADGAMPMTNSVSMVFLDRRASDFTDPHQLLESIQQEMQLIKRMQLQYTFILSLSVSRLLPGGLARETQADKCRSTSCLSNLGPVLARTPLPRREGAIVSGNLVLEAVDFVIPLRPHTNAAFCLYTYAGRLRVLMHFDPRAITQRQSQDLLETYVRRLGRTIDGNNRL